LTYMLGMFSIEQAYLSHVSGHESLSLWYGTFASRKTLRCPEVNRGNEVTSASLSCLSALSIFDILSHH